MDNSKSHFFILHCCELHLDIHQDDFVKDTKVSQTEALLITCHEAKGNTRFYCPLGFIFRVSKSPARKVENILLSGLRNIAKGIMHGDHSTVKLEQGFGPAIKVKL